MVGNITRFRDVEMRADILDVGRFLRERVRSDPDTEVLLLRFYFAHLFTQHLAVFACYYLRRFPKNGLCPCLNFIIFSRDKPSVGIRRGASDPIQLLQIAEPLRGFEPVEGRGKAARIRGLSFQSV